MLSVRFLEADVEIGFSLVDLARENPSSARRILDDARVVLDDIDQRLSRFSDADRAPFGPLVAELRREVDHATACAELH
jgi:hypothetical protein